MGVIGSGAPTGGCEDVSPEANPAIVAAAESEGMATIDPTASVPECWAEFVAGGGITNLRRAVARRGHETPAIWTENRAPGYTSVAVTDLVLRFVANWRFR